MIRLKLSPMTASIILALSAGVVALGVTHLSAQTSSKDEVTALHCQHFPADCEAPEEAPQAMDMESSSDALGHPTEPGQGIFGAISEISKIIDESDSDWSKVDMDTLWEHLKDMDALMTHAKLEKTSLDNGLIMSISGEGSAARAVTAMIPAHSEFMKSVRPSWNISISEKGVASYDVTVTSDDPIQALKIKALGFTGFMVQDDHHASHHLGLAIGTQVH